MRCERCNGEGQVPKGPYFAPDGDDLFDVCGACGGDGGDFGEDSPVDAGDEAFGPAYDKPCPVCEDIGDKTCPFCGGAL